MYLKSIGFVVALVVGACHHRTHKAVPSSWAGSVYVVRSGDTIHSIASKTKISAFELMEVNGITDTSVLKSGYRLYIPEPEIALVQSKPSKSPKTQPSVPKAYAVEDGKKINLAWPMKGGVLFKGFDLNPKQLHEGISIAAPKGTSVTAAQDGEVIYVGDDGTRYGRIVILKHEDPFVTIYTHLEEVDVSKGQKLKKRERLGTVGTSGGVDSPRLYFQVRKHRTPVDPEVYLVK